MAALALNNRRANPWPFALLAVVLIVAVLLIVRNAGHADAKHKEAPMVRATYKNQLCTATEAWVWPAAGTVLVLCKIPDTEQWGGMTFRFIENGLALVDPTKGAVRYLDGTDQAYEATTLVERRAYWDRVIARGYVPIARYTELDFRFFSWLWSVL